MTDRVLHCLLEPQLHKIAEQIRVFQTGPFYRICDLRVVSFGNLFIVNGQEVRNQFLLLLSHVLTVVFDVMGNLLNGKRDAFLLTTRGNAKRRHNGFRNDDHHDNGNYCADGKRGSFRFFRQSDNQKHQQQ